MRAACCEATVLRNEVIAPDIRLLTVVWPDRDHAPHAGQFFTLRAWGADEAPFLSRPISVHRWNPDSSTIEFLYQVVGEGTEKIAQLKMKDTFQLTGPMGNGFDVPDILSKYKKIAVVGGGIGTAPMFQLTRELAAAGVKPDVFFGFRDAPYCMEEYREIANLVKVSTDTGADGAVHHKAQQVGFQVSHQKNTSVASNTGPFLHTLLPSPPLVSQVQPRQAPMPQAIFFSMLTKQGVPFSAHRRAAFFIITVGPQISTAS